MEFDKFCETLLEMHSKEFDLEFAVELSDKAIQNIFASLWADWMQEEIPKSSKYFVNMSGMEITEIAPRYTEFMKPKEARALENKIYDQIAKFEEVNDNTDIKDLYEYALKIDGQISNDNPEYPMTWENHEEDSSPEMFGYYILMKMMGHGVAWEDDHEDPGFNYPHFELSYLEFPNSFRPKTDMTADELGIREEDEDEDEIEDWEEEGEDWKDGNYRDSSDDWKK